MGALTWGAPFGTTVSNTVVVSWLWGTAVMQAGLPLVLRLSVRNVPDHSAENRMVQTVLESLTS